MAQFLNNDACMPLIFANGFPALIHDLKEEQLECFLKYLWDFTDVPLAARFLPPISINPKTRLKHLKTVIRNVYARLGCKYLLHLSELIALRCNKRKIVFKHVTVADKNMVNLYDSRGMNLIVSVPRSNLTYDLALQHKYRMMPEPMRFIRKKSRSEKQKLSSTPDEVINLDADDDEIIVLDSDDAPLKEDLSELKSFENSSSEFIMVPKLSRTKVLQSENDTVPKIEFAVSLPSDDPSQAYYVSSESEPENDYMQDPLTIVPKKEENQVVYISDSDSESNGTDLQASPQKMGLEAQKKNHFESDTIVRPISNISSKCEEKNCGVSQTKDVILKGLLEKSYVISRSSPTLQNRNCLSKEITKVNIFTSNKTYSQIKYEKERQALKSKIGANTENPKKTVKFPNNIPARASEAREIYDISDSDSEIQDSYDIPDSIIVTRNEVQNPDQVDDYRCEVQKECKVSFMNYLELHNNADSLNDLIILPEMNKKHFIKFYKFPINMVPYLASKQLIDSSCVCPGEPGQDSCYTSTTNINLTRRYRGRTGSSLARKRAFNLENAREYKFPKKTYRTRPPVLYPAAKKLDSLKKTAGEKSAVSKSGKIQHDSIQNIPQSPAFFGFGSPEVNALEVPDILGLSTPKSIKGTRASEISKSGKIQHDSIQNIPQSPAFFGFGSPEVNAGLEVPDILGLSTPKSIKGTTELVKEKNFTNLILR